MKKIVLVLLLGAALLLVVAACQPDPTPPPDALAEPQNQPTYPSAGGSDPGEQADEVAEEASEELEGSPEPTGVPLDEAGAAMDIPIPEDAYKYQIMRKGSSASYQVDLTIDELLTWYQEELPKFGWELAGPPDSGLGAIATMLRENEAGDRLTINMQANTIGGFVSVTIQVIRSGS